MDGQVENGRATPAAAKASLADAAPVLIGGMVLFIGLYVFPEIKSRIESVPQSSLNSFSECAFGMGPVPWISLSAGLVALALAGFFARMRGGSRTLIAVAFAVGLACIAFQAAALAIAAFNLA